MEVEVIKCIPQMSRSLFTFMCRSHIILMDEWCVCVCVCAYQQALKFWYVMNTHFVLENKHNTDITKI